MTFSKITYSVENNIATIALNDPATMNAAGVDTAQELLLAFEYAADEARATILTGMVFIINMNFKYLDKNT